MSLINNIPLRRVIPATILVFAVVMLVLSFAVIKPFVGELLYQNLESGLRSTLNRLQGTTEYLLSKGDLEGVRREVAATSAHIEVKNLLMIDASGKVVAASQLSYVGQLINSVPIHYESSLIDEVKAGWKPAYHRQQQGENTIYGAAPYLYPDTENGFRERRGLVILEVDIDRTLNQVYRRLDTLFMWVGIAVVVLAGFSWLLLERAVNRRLVRITDTVHRLAAEDFSHRTLLQGKDELSMLGQTLDQMADRLEQNRYQLVQANRQMENILRFIPSMVYIKDPEGRYRLVNERFVQVLGEPDEGGTTVFDVLPEPFASEIADHDRRVLESREARQFHISFPVQGEMHNWFMVKFPLVNEEGQVYAICTVATDVTEQERNENLARIAQRVFEHTTEGIMITDAENRIVDVNQSLVEMTGYTRDQLLGQPPSLQRSDQQDAGFYASMWKALQTQGKWSGELINQRADGQYYPVRLSISTILNRQGERDGFFGIFQDITEEKKSERDLHLLAYHDTLTGLFNRTEFMRILADALKRGERYGEPFGLLFIDLDLFKEVNDSFGHAAGDKLLCQVAERLRGCLRETDHAFRLGGDEFTVLLPKAGHDSDLTTVADKLIEQLREPFLIEGQKIQIGCSIGMVSYPRDGSERDTLLGHADAAMYFAKEQGRGRYAFFDPQINARNQRVMKIKTGLNQALEKQELSLVYQPRVHSESRKVTGYEALLRWNSEELGSVSPAEFIPIAETTEVLGQMTAWLLHQVAQDLSHEVMRGKQVSINLSPRQFQTGNWAATLKATIEQYRLRPDQLCIEVTENALVENFQATAAQLEEMQALGVEVAIDDFGTGYSSLEYLKRLPIDYLKIDRSFVRDIETDADDRVIVETIIVLAHSLGLQVVAEGVETSAQAEFLQARGCDELQGYLFSAPRPLSEHGEQQVKI
ncbi:bifunctional diguanylate cyclase/phosphodiesterase [Marinobacterium sediminicola]|uniref:PAS domain S-box-containing protein/diguanylate cyclase (GGDEF) domain-containing protein n=1 Tax=Marinobacterium sediminicola TaxID=518898 RepID=A0ABY1S1S8_9GAMM|nr:EAL domain-containing protein [Marinobacterium sediminicola]ULG69786.1 EAL domain-containing protein [Marinobacterium sediminicola]SMR75400.1 PAS domain S-box-containing protein/diguanylate cyclase (GGDEF) domain-containing protein [Marinobacterium sediminicola]